MNRQEITGETRYTGTYFNSTRDLNTRSMLMNAKNVSRLVPVSVAVLIATTGLLIAGPLNPPSGPIASTGNTLTEVEPRIAINLPQHAPC